MIIVWGAKRLIRSYHSTTAAGRQGRRQECEGKGGWLSTHPNHFIQLGLRTWCGDWGDWGDRRGFFDSASDHYLIPICKVSLVACWTVRDTKPFQLGLSRCI